MKYNPQRIIGDFFEEKIAKIFNLIRIDKDSKGQPDLISEDESFIVEAKASRHKNGGVIVGEQLNTYEEITNKKRFYGFAYHAIPKKVHEYKNETELRKALESSGLKSFFLLPLSIVLAHYKHTPSKKKKHPTKGPCTQLREKIAKKIFNGDPKIWEYLELDTREYRRIKPHPIINIMTRQGDLEKEILKSFVSLFI